MEELKFKTNINCTGCLSKVSPQLDNKKGIEKWEVNLEDPKKILTVKSNSVSQEMIIDVVEKVGFKIQKIN